jgi:hypothetical protein
MRTDQPPGNALRDFLMRREAKSDVHLQRSKAIR